MKVRKRKNETNGALLYRFNRRVRQSGLIKEARKRRFLKRPTSKRNRLLSALHREEKRVEFKRKKKLGVL
ncbi:MAG: 30S ribosomal protein S21 [Candidatus Harrisonbacteria bacterium]|nr:30S ribosomal protein S21 [Candidatus Harrisonbacteria bacterium]